MYRTPMMKGMKEKIHPPAPHASAAMNQSSGKKMKMRLPVREIEIALLISKHRQLK